MAAAAGLDVDGGEAVAFERPRRERVVIELAVAEIFVVLHVAQEIRPGTALRFVGEAFERLVVAPIEAAQGAEVFDDLRAPIGPPREERAPGEGGAVARGGGVAADPAAVGGDVLAVGEQAGRDGAALGALGALVAHGAADGGR